MAFHAVTDCDKIPSTIGRVGQSPLVEFKLSIWVRRSLNQCFVFGCGYFVPNGRYRAQVGNYRVKIGGRKRFVKICRHHRSQGYTGKTAMVWSDTLDQSVFDLVVGPSPNPGLQVGRDVGGSNDKSGRRD